MKKMKMFRTSDLSDDGDYGDKEIRTAKTFKDLVFKSSKIGYGLESKMFFSNGYGISVIRFKLPGLDDYCSYTDNENEWEVAVLKGNKKEWDITYDTIITDDVVGHLSDSDVTDIMKKIQKLR